MRNAPPARLITYVILIYIISGGIELVDIRGINALPFSAFSASRILRKYLTDVVYYVL